MVLGPRRDLPAPGNLAQLQTTCASIVFFGQFRDCFLYGRSIGIDYIGNRFGVDGLIRDKDQRLNNRLKFGAAN